jgi:hypothetical protein
MVSPCGKRVTDIHPSAPQGTIPMVLWAEDFDCCLFFLDDFCDAILSSGVFFPDQSDEASSP